MTLTRMIIVLTTLTAADKTHLRLINSTAISMLEGTTQLSPGFDVRAYAVKERKLKVLLLYARGSRLLRLEAAGLAGLSD